VLLIHLLSIFISTLFAQDLVRLDDFGSLNLKESGTKVHLYISENCSVCQSQIDVLKDCVPASKVHVYIEGKNEEKLRFYVKRKKVPFKTYLLTNPAKKYLGYKKASPAITYINQGKFKTIEGLQNCKQIQKQLKDDN
jgi:hypothetical protein